MHDRRKIKWENKRKRVIEIHEREKGRDENCHYQNIEMGTKNIKQNAKEK